MKQHQSRSEESSTRDVFESLFFSSQHWIEFCFFTDSMLNTLVESWIVSYFHQKLMLSSWYNNIILIKMKYSSQTDNSWINQHMTTLIAKLQNLNVWWHWSKSNLKLIYGIETLIAQCWQLKIYWMVLKDAQGWSKPDYQWVIQT